MKQTIDARKLPCPQPVIRAKDALKEIKEGTLEVLVDNEIAVRNLMKLGGYSGLKPVSEKLSDEEFRVIFQVSGQTEGAGGMQNGQQETKTASLEAEEASEPEAACSVNTMKRGQVVVLSSEFMGEGGEELGRILMKGFVYALTQLDRLPETVLLYNGGAKLSMEGAPTIEDLKSLEAEGVEILTCGTCINYYGLPSEPAVGGVTNMYEIAEKLAGASSIIRP